MLIGMDLSAGALQVAQVNVRRELPTTSPPVELLRGDLTSGLGAQTLDVLVANPPYLSEAERAAAPAELGYEPTGALCGGDADGLGALRRLVVEARRVLCDGGWLVSEIGSGQGPAAGALVTAMGFADVRVLQDLAGLDRVVVGRWREGPLPCEGELAEDIAPSA